MRITNLSANTTIDDINTLFSHNSITDITLWPMEPKPGFKTTVIQQASVRWISEQPQKEQYISNKLFKEKESK